MAETRALHFQGLNQPPLPARKIYKEAWRWAVWPVAFGLTPLTARAQTQTVSTVRELEFRSRWSNYNADQPQLEQTTARVNPETGEAVRRVISGGYGVHVPGGSTGPSVGSVGSHDAGGGDQ